MPGQQSSIGTWCNRLALLSIAGATSLIVFPALACPSCSASAFVCIPGLEIMGIHVGLAIGILRAFIERPFYTLGGVEKGALALSLQANLISMILLNLAGCVVISVVWRNEYLMYAWLPLAAFISGVVEISWVEIRYRPLQTRGWGWIFLGNAISVTATIVLPYWRHVFGTSTLPYIRSVEKWAPVIGLSTIIVVAIVYIVAFKFSPPKPQIDDKPRGFEVLPAHQTSPADQSGSPDILKT